MGEALCDNAPLQRRFHAPESGLHTGKPVQLTLYPARAGSGIVFVRTDLPSPVEIPASPASLTSKAHLATTLSRGDVTLDTVEHLLAAAYGLGVDNLRVEVEGPEIPGMDGSAASFVFLIRAAGIYEQSVPRNVLRIARPVEIEKASAGSASNPGAAFASATRSISSTPALAARPCTTSISPKRASSARSRALAPLGSSTKSMRSGGPVARAARAWTTPSCSTRLAC